MQMERAVAYQENLKLVGINGKDDEDTEEILLRLLRKQPQNAEQANQAKAHARCLQFRGNRLNRVSRGIQDVGPLMEFLRTNRNLRELDLTNNPIQKGFIQIERALADVAQLRLSCILCESGEESRKMLVWVLTETWEPWESERDNGGEAKAYARCIL